MFCDLCVEALIRQFVRDAAMKTVLACALVVLVARIADAGVVRLRVERREPVLNGRTFGAAGAYEKLVGKVEFAVDPNNPR
ncbi:MAG: hypothetical protein JF601_02735, partial [Acidobacteria bacterium]|nr:hypothetical protein [Acidobacteriota bacterium]